MVKLKRKIPSMIIACMLVMVMFLTSVIPTLAMGTVSVGSVAADVDGDIIIGQDYDQGKQTKYSNDITVGDTAIEEECDVYVTLPDSDIIVTVPKVVILSGKAVTGNVGEYTVKVQGDISAENAVFVKPLDKMEDRDGINLELSSVGKTNIPADVEQTKTKFTYEDGVRGDTAVSSTGTVTAYDMTAGQWNGNFNFNIQLKNKDLTDYSVEEIAADETLVPIGATQPDFVVAKFNEDYSEVTITKNGENSDGLVAYFAWMQSPMWKNNSTLKNVVVKSGVENISNGLFESSHISSVTLNKGLKNIEDRAFMDCNLTSVNIPSTVTNIGENAFYSCANLTSVDIPNSVLSIGSGAFYENKALKSIVIPDSVTSLGKHVFYNCTSLESVVIGSGITRIDSSTFYGCKSLESVTIPANVTNIDSLAFAYCPNLTSVIVSNNATVIAGNAFKGSPNVTIITKPLDV